MPNWRERVYPDTISVHETDRNRVGAPAAGGGPRVPGRRAPGRRGLPRALDERMACLRGWQARCYEAGYVGPRVAARVRRRRPAGGRADRRRPGAGGRRRAGVRQRRRARRARARRCCASAPTSSAAATSRRSSRPTRSGARASPSPRPDPTSRRCARARVERDGDFVLERAEDLGLVGAVRALVRRARAHRATPGPGTAGISMLIVDMQLAGRRGAADDADHRPRGVLRALPRRRRRAQGEPARRAAATAGRSRMHTLGHERGTAALPRQVKLRTWLDRAVRVAAERTVDGEPLLDDPARRPRSPGRWSASRCCATTRTGRSASSSTAAPSGRTARASSC